MAGVRIGRPQIFVELDRGAKQRMVKEVPADRQVPLDRNPHRLQLLRRSDARAQQDRRTVDGAGAQHDLARADVAGPLPFDVDAEAGCPAVADQHAVDQRMPANFQIGAARAGSR